MAEKKLGDTTLRELKPAYEGDPQNGFRIVRRFEGPHDDAVAESQLFLAAGYTVSVDPVNPNRAILYVRQPNNQDGQQPPVDTWERTTELVQEDIRSNPKLIASIIATVTPTGSNSAFINKLYKEIKDKLKAGTEFSYPSNTAFQAFADLIALGAEAYLVRRIVLRRRRIIMSSVPAQSNVNAVESFYRTGVLISAFSIPNGVASSLPVAGPTTPDNTAWGWMERMDTSIVTPAYAQTEEVKDFVFAAWSTLLYNYIS